MKTDRYFLALVLPEPLQSLVTAFKEECRSKYNSGAALRSPAHITLHMPFDWRTDREEQLIGQLHSLKTLKEIPVQLNGFDCFAPRVIFIAVDHSDGLHSLQREVRTFCRQQLGLLNANYRELPFHPHVTIAFRDLNKARFDLAWQAFSARPFAAGFTASAITLLRHNGQNWVPLHEIPLSSESSPGLR